MSIINSETKIANPTIGVILINQGTPDSAEVPDVRKYLREFLMDKRVIDIPFLTRFILVNFIIAPFRAPKSAKIYKKLWTEKGSPLKFYGLEISDLLQKKLDYKYEVRLAMRYQSPSIDSVLKEFKNKNFEKIIIIPLFPQYASATTGSVNEKVMDLISEWQAIPAIKFVGNFFDHPKFIKAFAEIGIKYLNELKYDHILFSYHGLPERQILKTDNTGTCLQGDCCATLHAMNRSCYRAQCFETTRLIAKELNLGTNDYTVSFQSRLGKNPWIKPYSDFKIVELAQKGYKKILTFSPSFIADCLETTIEIGDEYKELFEANGGEHWQLVESLNVNEVWIEALKEMVEKNDF